MRSMPRWQGRESAVRNAKGRPSSLQSASRHPSSQHPVRQRQANRHKQSNRQRSNRRRSQIRKSPSAPNAARKWRSSCSTSRPRFSARNAAHGCVCRLSSNRQQSPGFPPRRLHRRQRLPLSHSRRLPNPCDKRPRPCSKQPRHYRRPRFRRPSPPRVHRNRHSKRSVRQPPPPPRIRSQRTRSGHFLPARILPVQGMSTWGRSRHLRQGRRPAGSRLKHRPRGKSPLQIPAFKQTGFLPGWSGTSCCPPSSHSTWFA